MNYNQVKEDLLMIQESPSINNWEQGFIKSIAKQIKIKRQLTSRQLSKLDEIKHKVKNEKKEYRNIKVSHNSNINYIPQSILDKLYNELKKEKSKYNIYLYGSQMYGTQDFNSDFDFLVVFEKDITKEQYLSDDLDITYKNKKDMIEHLKNGSINFIENIQGLIESDFDLEVDVKLNRRFLLSSINQAEKSLIKGLRYIESEDKAKAYRGKKSLFHSLRILLNAKNLLKNEEIDFHDINELYERCKNYSVKDYKNEFYRRKDTLWNYL